MFVYDSVNIATVAMGLCHALVHILRAYEKAVLFI